VIDLGVFGILAVVTAAVFAWIGGHADARVGPKPVIVVCLVVLVGLATTVVFLSRDAIFGIPVPPGSAAPDIVFYVVGAGIGAAGGALQASSRSMMCRQGAPGQMTEAFGLYALAGKATAFLAPLLVGVVTDATGSQHLGIAPLIALFLSGLILLGWTKPDGAREEWILPPGSQRSR